MPDVDGRCENPERRNITDFAEYAGISRNFAEYHGISRNFVVHVACAPVFCVSPYI